MYPKQDKLGAVLGWYLIYPHRHQGRTAPARMVAGRRASSPPYISISISIYIYRGIYMYWHKFQLCHLSCLSGLSCVDEADFVF